MIADGAGPVMWATFAGPAALVAFLGIADNLLSRVLGWISAFFAVVIAGLGLVAPGSAALPTLVWYLTCMVFLAIRGVRPTSSATTEREHSPLLQPVTAEGEVESR
ncbi:MAG: hypothetical protein WAN48_15735, partial [Actinomycetes bacterium]